MRCSVITILFALHMSFAGGQLVIQTGLTQKEQNEMFLLAAARHLTNQLSLACSECPRENEAVTGWPIGRSIWRNLIQQITNAKGIADPRGNFNDCLKTQSSMLANKCRQLGAEVGGGGGGVRVRARTSQCICFVCVWWACVRACVCVCVLWFVVT